MLTYLLHFLLTHQHIPVPFHWHTWPTRVVAHDPVPFIFRQRIPLYPH